MPYYTQREQIVKGIIVFAASCGGRLFALCSDMKTGKNSFITIDGSYGEGGGQILRTSLALSCALGRPFAVTNIRKNRKKPGLQPQHLTAVKAAAAISSAAVEGAEFSSTDLTFAPQAVGGGDYRFDVSEKKGSAGSTSLVLQTVLLPLLFADAPSAISIIGGTHVPWSPPFHYLSEVFLPLLARMDARVHLAIEQWGWYPIGGGTVAARATHVPELKPIVIADRGKLLRVRGISAVSNLPMHIAERQKRQTLKNLARHNIDAEVEIYSAPSPGKGSFLFLVAEFENVSAGFSSLGAIGKRAEDVADEACRGLLDYYRGTGALEPHLADQIIPYLALAKGQSECTVSSITRHLLTNIWVVKHFTDIVIRVEGQEGEAGRVTVDGQQ